VGEATFELVLMGLQELKKQSAASTRKTFLRFITRNTERLVGLTQHEYESEIF
jgi:hypothetical protein